jgi:hypothetical protein
VPSTRLPKKPGSTESVNFSFSLSSDQRTQIARALKIAKPKLLPEKFFLELESEIGEYGYFYAVQRYDRKTVRKKLTALSKHANPLKVLLTDLFFKKAFANPDDHFTAELIHHHLPNPRNSDYAEQQCEFLAVIHALDDLSIAIKDSLSTRHLSSTKRKFNDPARQFVGYLATAYSRATGKQPGIGENALFGSFVKQCFVLAGHRSDPQPYIREVLRKRR